MTMAPKQNIRAAAELMADFHGGVDGAIKSCNRSIEFATAAKDEESIKAYKDIKTYLKETYLKENKK